MGRRWTPWAISRAFTLVAAALAVATVIGLVLLWPGQVDSRVAQGIAVDSQEAKVDSVREVFCAGFQTQQCQFVEATIESGPETGKHIELQLGTGGLDPDV